MSAKYFLMNGKHGHSNSINLNVRGNIVTSFDDISSLDVETLKMTIKEAKEKLPEYNEDINIDGVFYDLSYPHTKTKDGKKVIISKTYAPMFYYDNQIVKYYLENLRYFAEQRNYKKKNNQLLALDYDQKLQSYMYRLFSEIVSNCPNTLTDYDSLISKYLKGLIEDCKLNNKLTIKEYIDSKSMTLSRFFTSYTELRNITIEYVLYLLGKNTKIRSRIKNCALWDNEGINGDKNIYRQMELQDYINTQNSLKRTLK